MSIVDTATQNYSHELMLFDIDTLHTVFPGLLRVDSLGMSMLGRDIPLLEIGNPNAHKAVWVEGSNHGREYMTTQVILRQLEFLLQNYDRGILDGILLKKALNSVNVYIVPMLNPDGVELSQRGLCSTPEPARSLLLQMNNGSEDFTKWKANVRGVDLNSNFYAHWIGKDTGVCAPAPQGYKGSQPFSEPETQAAVNFIDRTDISVSLSYHAQGGEIYWYFYQDGKRRERDRALAELLAKRTGYRLMSEEESLSGGGLRDYQIERHSRMAYTIEIGPSSTDATPVPIEDFHEIFRQNQYVIWSVINYIYQSSYRNLRPPIEGR